MKRRTKIFLRPMVAGLLCICMVIQSQGMFLVSAATKTYTIDNDDAHGYSNNSVGFTNYLVGNTLQNNDARTQKNTSNQSAGNYYQWNFPTYSKSKANIQAKVGIYLYHDYFTDRYALYTLKRNSTVFQTVGVVDQRYAIAGWTYKTCTVKPINANGSNSIQAVRVEPGNRDSSAFTGADAVRITLS